MAAGKKENRQPSKVARWKDMTAYDVRAKAANWLRFLKRDTALVTKDEAAKIMTVLPAVQKGNVGTKTRLKAVGIQAVVQALRMHEDVNKVASAVTSRDWATVTRLVQPIGTPVDYTPRKKTHP